jgi:hypothetical protein
VPDNHINLIYRPDGQVSEIDVFKLAPTLLAFGELIQESNQLLNPSGRQVGVNVKPFRQGSFVIDLTVFPHTHLQQFLDLLNSKPLDDIKKILEWIGIITGGAISAIHAIKFLKGKPKSVGEIAPGEFRYTADDKSITVNLPVHQLLSSASITANIYRVYASPLEELQQVTDVRTYLDGEPKSACIITRNEAPAIKDFVSAPLSANPQESIKESLQKDVWLNPKRGAFDGDGKEWSFRRGDEIVVASIRDKDFLARCMNGEYRLNHSDLLIVDLLERQRVIGTQVMRPIYEIIVVSSYIPGPKQQNLEMD